MMTLRKTILFISLLGCTIQASGQGSKWTINFEPESEKFAEATRDYRSIWSSEGKRIVETMESTAGLKFESKDVRAIVFEGVSSSGFGDDPMKLRASYPFDVKKGTLIHELGHRLLSPVRKSQEIDEHRALFLVLYDIWEKLYGKEFADSMVEVEKKRKGIYDYESAWKWALEMTKEERAAKFKDLRNRQ